MDEEQVTGNLIDITRGAGGSFRKDDVVQPQIRTIKGIVRKQFDDGPSLFVTFSDDSRQLRAGKTVLGQVQEAAGASDVAGLVGVEVEMYLDKAVRDPSGNVVGGIRVRPPTKNGQRAPREPGSDDAF